MSNETDIEAAMRNAFFVAIPAAVSNTALENQPFDKRGKAKWFAFHYIPNRPQVATLGAGGTDEFTGLVQIDINVELGKGKADVEADITALRSAFTPGQRVTYASANVIIRGCGRIPGRPIDGFYRYSISIPWETRLARN